MGNIIALCEAEKVLVDLRVRILRVERLLDGLASLVKSETQNAQNAQIVVQDRLDALEAGVKPIVLRSTHQKLW